MILVIDRISFTIDNNDIQNIYTYQKEEDDLTVEVPLRL